MNGRSRCGTCQALLLPPEPIELLLWINDTFQVDLSPDWIYQYLKEENGEYSLFGVTGKAMERSRAEITAKALQEWEQNELKTKLHTSIPFCLPISMKAPTSLGFPRRLNWWSRRRIAQLYLPLGEGPSMLLAARPFFSTGPY